MGNQNGYHEDMTKRPNGHTTSWSIVKWRFLNAWGGRGVCFCFLSFFLKAIANPTSEPSWPFVSNTDKASQHFWFCSILCSRHMHCQCIQSPSLRPLILLCALVLGETMESACKRQKRLTSWQSKALSLAYFLASK